MTRDGSSRKHLIPLKGTTWSLWRDTVLRSAGFPARDVLILRDPDVAAAADATTPKDVGSDSYQNAFTAAAGRCMVAVTDVARRPLFREALAWQNPDIITNCLDKLLRGRLANSKTRASQVRVAAYMQRYALKNDSIGFFGPIAWASLDGELEGFTALPGPDVVAQRSTHFEVWAIDAVGQAFAGMPGVEPWIMPERAPGSILTGRTLHQARRPPHELSDVEARVWRSCDGRTCVKDVVGNGPDADTRRNALNRLREAGAILVDLESAVSAKPEVDLRRKVELIGAETLRTDLLAKLDRLIAARDELGRVRSADEVTGALEVVEQRFREITGVVNTSRRRGEMYAGRTLVYQDTLRDLEVVVGRVVLDELARPLGLMLDSARWLIARVGERYRALVTERVRADAARLGRDDVPLNYLIARLTPEVTETERGVPATIQELLNDFQARWSRVLGPLPPDARNLDFSGAQLAEAVAREFPHLRSPWRGANIHSPDVMIASQSPEAVAAGRFLLVLGELHLTRNTLENRASVEFHPDPAQLVAALEADTPDGCLVGVPPKDSPFVTSRVAPPTALISPSFTYWAWSDSRASIDPPGGILPGADLYARDGADGVLVFSRSTGRSFDVIDVLSDILSAVVCNAFRPLAPASHLPRITIDKLVMQRESWTPQVLDMEWVLLHDDAARFAAARYWRARLGIPERVFVKVPVEIKPTAVDFASPSLVAMFAKAVRRTREAGHATITLTEMLPEIEEAWLTDAKGCHYTSEFRLVAVYEQEGYPHV